MKNKRLFISLFRRKFSIGGKAGKFSQISRFMSIAFIYRIQIFSTLYRFANKIEMKENTWSITFGINSRIYVNFSASATVLFDALNNISSFREIFDICQRWVIFTPKPFKIWSIGLPEMSISRNTIVPRRSRNFHSIRPDYRRYLRTFCFA